MYMPTSSICRVVVYYYSVDTQLKMSSARLVRAFEFKRYNCNCNCSFEGGNGGFDSDECSDDGDSRHDVVGLPSLTHLLSIIYREVAVSSREERQPCFLVSQVLLQVVNNLLQIGNIL